LKEERAKEGRLSGGGKEVISTGRPSFGGRELTGYAGRRFEGKGGVAGKSQEGENLVCGEGGAPSNCLTVDYR